jgi:hypothetical protein
MIRRSLTWPDQRRLLEVAWLFALECPTSPLKMREHMPRHPFFPFPHEPRVSFPGRSCLKALDREGKVEQQRVFLSVERHPTELRIKGEHDQSSAAGSVCSNFRSRPQSGPSAGNHRSGASDPNEKSPDISTLSARASMADYHSFQSDKELFDPDN